MNWDALGALAELFGAVGVIGSLIYLGAQLLMRIWRLMTSDKDPRDMDEMGVYGIGRP